MEAIKGRKGGNVRNKRTRHERPKVRAAEAKVRQEAYSKLTLDQKLAQQEPFKGKQYRKLLALKEKQSGNQG